MVSEDEQSDYVNELLKFILNLRVKQGLSEKSTEMIIKKFESIVDCCSLHGENYGCSKERSK